jgi:hypothetical protein
MSRELLLKILLWYNVVSLGIWVGGTVFSMTVIVPIWNASPPETLRSFFTGTTYMTTVYNFFGPVTQVTRVLPVFILLGVAWTFPSVRPWLIACAATVLFGLIMTRAYVYPINDVLFARAGEGLSADEIRALAGRWVIADRLRFAIMGGGYLCLLRAFSLPL